MIPMTGEIGTWSINDEQVGGFKYWTATYNRDTEETRVIVSQFWKLKEFDAQQLTADFYYHEDGKLKLVYSVDVKIKLPKCEIDKKINKRIEMHLGKFDWLQNPLLSSKQ